MKLLSIKEHPNGLKVLVASQISGQKVEVEVKRGERWEGWKYSCYVNGKRLDLFIYYSFYYYL